MKKPITLVVNMKIGDLSISPELAKKFGNRAKGATMRIIPNKTPNKPCAIKPAKIAVEEILISWL